MSADMTEQAFESLIVDYLRDTNGYTEGSSALYEKSLALVPEWLEAFLQDTQPEKVAKSLCFASVTERDRFYTRLTRELAARGVLDVLRKGFSHNGVTFMLYAPLPSKENPTAQEFYARNNFGVIRQLHYSSRAPQNAIDFALFINGLPLATFELKNHYTGQSVENAIAQYKTDRDPKEPLLAPKRCAVHFAVDDTAVFMCTELKGAASWFLPFNRGVEGGAGNPVVPGKTMTSYLWEDILAKPALSNIIENFAQVVRTEDKRTHQEKERVIWPRYHQLDAVEKLLAATKAASAGRRFLIQHSAGSGKSNTITWLAYQLVATQRFNSVIVITDRVNLNKQIRDNIRAFQHRDGLVAWASDSGELKTALVGGVKIIVTTIQKFPFILDEMGSTLSARHFALVIDEAHSSQTGRMASATAATVAGYGVGEGASDDTEERILTMLKGRKLAANANYYAFTATPKNRTLEMFGEKRVDAAGAVTFAPFHEYTMKQAIEEGFILDVTRNYTPYKAYYEIMRRAEVSENPKFDKERAERRIHAFVESQPETIAEKSRIIVNHFCTKVAQKIGGEARAMVVTASIERAIEYFKSISRLLKECNSPYKAIVAFTPKEINGHLVTDAELNGFPSGQIEAKVESEPYRLLIVADMFQTGYDQPLLQTMYVDKRLSALDAVQTLSRLNRACPKKADTFVLDFVNTAEDIRAAFQPYYKTMILEGESDVNKLNDLIATIERKPFYNDEDKREVVEAFLSGAAEARTGIDSRLDYDVKRFDLELNPDEQVAAKSAMKNYCRIYPFFAAIMPYESPDWERYFLFYSLLVTKLPKLKKEDLTAGLLDTIALKNYSIQAQATRNLIMEDESAVLKPVPTGSGSGISEHETLDLLTIVKNFNARYGGVFKDEEGVARQIWELPEKICTDEEFENNIHTGNETEAQRRFYDVLNDLITAMGEENVEFQQQFFRNNEFRQLVESRVYAACLKNLKGEAKAPAVGWAVPLEEETEGGYLAAAEDEGTSKAP